MIDRHAYLSIVDPGHASTLWPWKNALQFQARDGYLKQIERVFRFNLLFRRSITVRHIDLFNNIVLMQFMRTPAAAQLCLSECLKVTMPDDALSLRQHFEQWAFRGQSQHWHHLSAEEQSEYDSVDFAPMRNARAYRELERRLMLSRFGLQLQDVVDGFDWRFGKGNRIILRHAPAPEKYAGNVLSFWNRVLLDPAQQALHSSRHLDAVSAVLARGAAEKWRRRKFFTELEGLERTLEPDTSLKSAIATAKIGAVNQAFYSELEEMGSSDPDINPVYVNRDVTYLLDGVRHTEVQKHGDTYLGDALRLLDDISLLGVANWRIKDGDEYDAFRKSVARFEYHLQGQSNLTPRQMNGELDEHLKIVNACIKRTASDEGKELRHETTLISAYLPRLHENVPNSVLPILQVAAPIAGYVAAHSLGATNFGQLLVGEAFALVSGGIAIASTLKIRKSEYRSIEVALKQRMKDELTGVSRHRSGEK